MNRWKSRNALNKRDVIEMRKELTDIKLSLQDVKKMIMQERMCATVEIKEQIAHEQKLLYDEQRESRNNLKVITEQLREILYMSQNNNSKSDDIEELMKMLLMDSLIKE